VVKRCERVGATAGMRMSLPFNLLPTSKDAELRSIVPRAIPEKTSTALTTGEQDEHGKVMFGSAFGKDGSLGSGDSDDRGDGSTTSIRRGPPTRRKAHPRACALHQLLVKGL
jgi:hypothetical protein